MFAGAILIWLFNSLANVIRGTGNMFLPAAVATAGAAVLIPISPMLIFGFGVVPRLGIAGGAVAVIVYYGIGTAIFAAYIWSGRGVLRPAMRPPRLTWPPAYEILRIGAVASLIAVSTNVTIAVATGLVGAHGPAAVAGYGTGVRLEYLLIPLAFGLGAPLVAMVGTNVGAGRRERALRVAWTGGAIAAALTGSDRHCGGSLPVRLAGAVRRRSADAGGRCAVPAHRRAVLRLLRRRHGALLRVAGRGPPCPGRCSPASSGSRSRARAAGWRCASSARSPACSWRSAWRLRSSVW